MYTAQKVRWEHTCSSVLVFLNFTAENMREYARNLKRLLYSWVVIIISLFFYFQLCYVHLLWKFTPQIWLTDRTVFNIVLYLHVLGLDCLLSTSFLSSSHFKYWKDKSISRRLRHYYDKTIKLNFLLSSYSYTTLPSWYLPAQS